MNQLNQLKSSKITNTFIKTLLFLMVFVSPMLVLQFCDKEIFLWLQIVFVLAMMITYKKIRLIEWPYIVIFFLEPFITAAFAQMSSITDIYKSTAINLAIMSLPLYFVICYLNKMTKVTKDVIEIIIKALRAAVIVEIVWIVIQTLLYRLYGFDINEFLFVDMFHMVDNASFVRNWVWYPSGLSWHSAVLAPLFVIGILVWDNYLVRISILLASFFCGNSTALIGVLLCFLLLFLYSFKNRNIRISDKNVAFFSILIFASVIILITTDLGSKLVEVVLSLWTRLFGDSKDASTAAHFGYYSDYFTIVKNSEIYQTIFGYGIGCSGYTITSLYGRYANGGTWAIECDYINILVSRGIIGFINFYLYLFYILVKGKRIDFRYFILIFVILIEGFGYNVQFDYLLLIEAVLFITIKNHINFFEIVDHVNGKKRIM